MSFRDVQNPGIGGLDELTAAEETVIQTIAGLGSGLQVLRTNAGATDIEWATAGAGDMVLASIQSVTGLKTFDTTKLAVKGSSTGTTAIASANAGASSYTVTLAAVTGTVALGTGTLDEIAYWVDANTLGTLAVATYPSLTELSYVKGASSALQTQITAKAPSTSPTFATSITGSYLTASEILITDGSKNIVSAAVATYPSLTELTYIKGVTSAIQTQFTGKAAVDQTFYIGTTQVAINRASAALTLAGLTLTTPDIGTPSAGVLTNCTGLPAASILAGSFGAGAYVISTSLQAATIELGHATDTTLSRSAAGVLAVEGVVIPSISSTNTLTNKRVQPRILSAASYTTDTGTSLNIDNCDIFIVTAQAGALLFNAPGGTLAQAERLVIRIKDNGTARALTWDAVFRAMGTALPSTTTLSKTMYMGFFYNSTDTKWDLVALATEA